ncbi:MAG: hypothetical protein OJI67_21575, partial [Prosthecobacter sp.]|nr:hypothetical protein [Prosthecobacter sp.]
ILGAFNAPVKAILLLTPKRRHAPFTRSLQAKKNPPGEPGGLCSTGSNHFFSRAMSELLLRGLRRAAGLATGNTLEFGSITALIAPFTVSNASRVAFSAAFLEVLRITVSTPPAMRSRYSRAAAPDRN